MHKKASTDTDNGKVLRYSWEWANLPFREYNLQLGYLWIYWESPGIQWTLQAPPPASKGGAPPPCWWTSLSSSNWHVWRDPPPLFMSRWVILSSSYWQVPLGSLPDNNEDRTYARLLYDTFGKDGRTSTWLLSENTPSRDTLPRISRMGVW